MSTLLIGASGLLAHQQKLDIVANNIANVNTNSYKSQRILFSDLTYTTIQPASGSIAGVTGGTNPKQTGNGVSISEISKDFSQGQLTNTGGAFDYSIEGDGFFVVSGTQQNFTRDGSFSVDGNGYLVDPATGGLVQRFGSVGEGSATEPGFQIPNNSAIAIPIGASVPGKATTQSDFIGNLPVSATEPLAEVLTTVTPFTASGSAASLATLMNDLDANTIDYQAGDAITLSGSKVDGSTFSINIPVGATTTLGDVVTAINSQLTDATASLSTAGNIVVTADQTGEALLSVKLEDAATNVGASALSQSSFVVETDGKEGDVMDTTIQVFDLRGEAHTLQVRFQKQDANTWDATFTSSDSSTQLTDSVVTGIRFKEDGTFDVTGGTGTGDSNIELTFDSLVGPQTIDIDFQSLTHRATNYSASVQQDGFPPGNIVSMSVSPEGVITGIASNGRRLEVAQLAIAKFANNQGLESTGQNYYVQTNNSGIPDIGPGNSAGLGAIRGGQLETSNVDIALEFTQLIVAQRGFSANARTITVATEVLQELNNILR